jgi:hypothetical protein
MASDPQDDDQYQEASPQTKINIATYFIMSSPTGEVHDVLKGMESSLCCQKGCRDTRAHEHVADVISLVNDPSVLTEERINAIMADYNTQNMVAATSPDGHEVQLCQYVVGINVMFRLSSLFTVKWITTVT